MTKNVMSGGYTAQEARNLLLIRGIEHVKGIIPHNAPKIANLTQFDDLPTMSVQGQWHSELYGYKVDRVKIYCIRFKFDEPVCETCCDALELWIQKSIHEFGGYRLIHFSHHWSDETCVLCGGVCDDTIPF